MARRIGPDGTPAQSRTAHRAASQFFGGRVCLDFANTLDWRTSRHPVELIPDYASLLSWSFRRGTLRRQAVARLLRCNGATDASSEVMAQAFALRSQLWAICEALRAHVRPTLTRFNAMLARAPSQPIIVASAGTFTYDLPGENPMEPLWPVVWSLSALLTSVDAQRIGLCRAGECGWFFVDESPNQSRLWCSSEICGNRERVRRSYARRTRRGTATRAARRRK